jgi:hypothetical protein
MRFRFCCDKPLHYVAMFVVDFDGNIFVHSAPGILLCIDEAILTAEVEDVVALLSSTFIDKA